MRKCNLMVGFVLDCRIGQMVVGARVQWKELLHVVKCWTDHITCVLFCFQLLSLVSFTHWSDHVFYLLIGWIVRFTEWSDAFFPLFLGRRQTLQCVKMCCEFELCVFILVRVLLVLQICCVSSSTLAQINKLQHH
jgi:hypothetical protein